MADSPSHPVTPMLDVGGFLACSWWVRPAVVGSLVACRNHVPADVQLVAHCCPLLALVCLLPAAAWRAAASSAGGAGGSRVGLPFAHLGLCKKLNQPVCSGYRRQGFGCRRRIVGGCHGGHAVEPHSLPLVAAGETPRAGLEDQLLVMYITNRSTRRSACDLPAFT